MPSDRPVIELLGTIFIAAAGAGQLTVSDAGPHAGALSESAETGGSLSEAEPRAPPRKQPA